MKTIIENYYNENSILPILLEQKIKKFERNTDIKDEFEYWIKNKQYLDKDYVVVEGYSAQQLADMSKYLDGEGAFMLLIELRENPKKAFDRISKGFKVK